MGGTFIVAIDGPAGAGKSSSARGLAAKLGLLYLDSGSLFRAVAWKVLNSNRDPGHAEGVRHLCSGLKLDLFLAENPVRLRVDGTEVMDLIRTPEVSRAASVVAVNPGVRELLLKVQRDCVREAGAGSPSRVGVVVEGRDIGTVVFPEAPAKFFLEASQEIRAKRRDLELRSRGLSSDLEKTREDLDQRDRRDSGRKVAPLRPAADAVRIDSTAMDLDGVIDQMVRVLKEKGWVAAESNKPLP